MAVLLTILGVIKNMGAFATLFDTVTIMPSSVDNFVEAKIKDDVYGGPTRALRVDIVATHSGRLTRNYGFYLPQKMKDGVNSLLENYGKPILTHHNSHEDPIGRIVAARYVDTSMAFARDSAVDSIVKGLCRPGLPFLQSLDLIDKLSQSELLRDPSYPGLGHILLTAEITNKDAIQKILDKRYLTVSTAASTDKAICSICKRDYIEEGPCEHVPGRLYDGELAYIIAGALKYDETSFVNVPADALARVVLIHGNGFMQDSTVLVEESRQMCNVNASFYFTDSIIGGTSMNEVQKAWGDVSKLIALEDSKKEDKVKALADFLEKFKDSEDACIQEAKDKLAELQSAGDAGDSDSGDQGDAGDTLDETDQHYEDMVEFGHKLSLFDEDFEDAKLSPGARKKMAKTTFCKPGERKYPVPDCNHAKVAMAYAKKNNEAASVVSCIRRKAKALGCPFNGKKDAFDEFEKELDVILADLAEREKTVVDADSNVQTPSLPPEQHNNDSATDECSECNKKVDALRQELKDIYAEFDCSQQAHVDTIEKAKGQLADALIVLDQLNGKKIEDVAKARTDAVSMPLEDLLKKASEMRDGLDMDGILSKLNDGMSRIPEGTVDDPTLNVQGAQDVTTNNSDDQYNKYRDKYNKILVQDGLKAAGEYVERLVRAGLVPNDFNPVK